MKWIPVPFEPTDDMLVAMWRGVFEEAPSDIEKAMMRQSYDRMLRAAPECQSLLLRAS